MGVFLKRVCLIKSKAGFWTMVGQKKTRFPLILVTERVILVICQANKTPVK